MRDYPLILVERVYRLSCSETCLSKFKQRMHIKAAQGVKQELEG